ncbi:cadmium resistance transporter [Scytonema sp. HK-05]|uniref:cadmium resistance transporter n=1 Tax=Scytonema sp. HK-05 TaxID=1137095 RepID=UPI0009356D23|nr:cadmium resistance transporter [Scytonema sp. HK-05]OKH57005.1 transporter [Scytonema sp. HK-05]BAY49497.1 cadmium resistance transporter [Scytonema sp. HK-05]
MSTLITAIPAGVAAFVATNIDDIVILTLLFAQVNTSLRSRHIVAGQYLGFTVLVAISLLGFFGNFMLPSVWMDVSGFIPIAIGLNRLVNLEEDNSDEQPAMLSSVSFPIRSLLSPQTYSVAAITIANGGDNIGIYMPLFANTQLTSLLVILSVFFVLVGVWCYAAYLLTHQKAIALIIDRYGNSLVPFLLIGLGVYIALDSLALAVLSVAVVFLGWMSFSSLREHAPSA